uniref:Uncharacterized protein n=1 Tax=Rhizophora mucronata TaxID=61149 RepID=A0A2P2Q5D3_RHIMU
MWDKSCNRTRLTIRGNQDENGRKGSNLIQIKMNPYVSILSFFYSPSCFNSIIRQFLLKPLQNSSF